MDNNFKNPPREYRGKPFWAWNGKLEENELKRQIDIIKEMGFGGFFMHSRVGLITEYLSKEWFALINKCADYGEEKNLEGWLYDEDRWPSGSAGGIATKHHEDRLHYIRIRKDDFTWSENVISAFSCRLEGINVYDIKKLKYGEMPEGDKIWFEIIEMKESPNYNGNTYLDTMSKSAVKNFLKTTHEKYTENCGDRIGTSIKGIFTDEPHRGGIMMDADSMASCTPYTPLLFDVFLERWGYDLRDKLPELFLRVNGEKISQVKWHYCETVQQLFLDSFMKTISEWCHNNNMLFTGHLLHEDTLSSQTIMNGSLMRSYEIMDCPGVDVLTEHNKNYNIVKQLSSVAHQCGKKWMLSELYGCTGWQMNFESYKNIGDWQALFGINLRCPHLSWYTMEGEGKRDYPASIFYQSAWYKEYSYLEDYYSRLGVFSSKGESLADTLVINPIESVWCQIYENWAQWLNSVSEDVLDLESRFDKFYRYLLSENVEFDYGDEEMISRLGKVENGEFILGQARYKKVILSDMLTIRSTTLTLLEKFQAQGGKVIVRGEKPHYVDAVKSEINIGNSDESEIIKDRNVQIENPFIFSSSKKDNEGIYIMLLNTDEKNSQCGKAYLPDGFYEKWNPETGDIHPVSKPDEISLSAGEMLLLHVSNKENVPEKEEILPEIRLGDEFEYSTDEMNVCVIDHVKCTVNGKTIEGDVLKTDRALRDMCNITYRGGEMYQPWYSEKMGIKSYFNIGLQYSFNSEIECDGFLALEHPERCEIRFNDTVINRTEGFYIDPSFEKLKIHIKKGENLVNLKTEFADNTNLEAIYILGEFGVYDSVIKEKPLKINKGDITKQGYQFYGGKISYKFNQKVHKKSKLRFDNLCGAAAIKVNGKILAWHPYEVIVLPSESVTVELCLTRRNTFGPLHLLPAIDYAYGPDSFLSQGEHWSDTPVVLPCGLEI